MTDLFDKQEREKEVRDFDAVWPDDDPQSIIDGFRQAYKDATGREAPAVTHNYGVYTVHFISVLCDQEYSAEQIKEATRRFKTRTMRAVQP